MFDLQTIGRTIFILGCSLAVIGLTLIASGRFLPWLGRLPGDMQLQRGNFSCFFPLVSSILLSLILTIIVNVLVRFFNR